MSAPATRPTDDALDRALEDGHARAATAGPMHLGLWRSLSDAAAGGKRFRPALVLATHEGLGGTEPAAAAQVGAAVEMLHTAFVVHDDVIDGDDVRRGRLNVSGTFTAQARAAGVRPAGAIELGRAAGILAGDLALAAAIGMVARCGAPAPTVHRLLDLFDAALHATAAGELADVAFSLQPGRASLDESLAMEAQKTSAYSFALPLQAGAVLAGAPEAAVERLGEVGLLLGAAFQLIDDLAGVFGDPTRTGKSTTGDLRTRKQTPLLIHAVSTSAADDLEHYLGRELTPEELAEARHLLTACGSRRFVEDLVESHLERARSVLTDLGVAAAVLPAVAGCFPDPPPTEAAVA